MKAAPITASSRPSHNVARILARKGGTAFLLNASGMVIAFLLQVLLARELGVDGYGHYAYVMTVLTFLVFPAKLGFDTTIVRYVAAYRSREQWGEVKGLLRYSNRWSVGLSLAVVGVGFVALWLYSDRVERELYDTFVIGLTFVPFLALATLRQSALQALNEVLYAQMPEKIIRPVLLAGCLYAAVHLGTVSSNAPTAMSLFGFSLLATYALGAWVLRRKTANQLKDVQPAFQRKEWMRTSLSLMANAGIYLILGQMGVLMMGMYLGTDDSGILSAAVRVASLVTFAMTAINMTAAPLMSAAYAENDMKRLQRVCTASGIASLAFAGAVLLVFLIFGREVMAVFGADFRAGYIPLLIMSAGQFVSALCGQTGMVMTMTGHQGILTKALIVSALLNVGLNAVLIPAYGMNGAAAAMCVAGSFWPIAMVFVVKRKLGIETSVLQAIFNRKRGGRQ
ncbi:flippase [Cohnella soli]|uniref:Flippase n=1 Tax=Cohnella soli TaxID=425005 RepID=A0ABW0HK29_9BACL